jgi:hypothetical protein
VNRIGYRTIMRMLLIAAQGAMSEKCPDPDMATFANPLRFRRRSMDCH